MLLILEIFMFTVPILFFYLLFQMICTLQNNLCVSCIDIINQYHKIVNNFISHGIVCNVRTGFTLICIFLSLTNDHTL